MEKYTAKRVQNMTQIVFSLIQKAQNALESRFLLFISLVETELPSLNGYYEQKNTMLMQ